LKLNKIVVVPKKSSKFLGIFFVLFWIIFVPLHPIRVDQNGKLFGFEKQKSCPKWKTFRKRNNYKLNIFKYNGN